MIPRNTQAVSTTALDMHNMSSGLPTVLGLAMLASRALSGEIEAIEKLSDEAQVLLHCAAERGVFEIRGNPDAFDSTDRLLAVCVEGDEGHWRVFKQKSEPRKTLGYLEGFRQLCQSGLVIHHLAKEFSLSYAGFHCKSELAQDQVAAELAWAETVEL